MSQELSQARLQKCEMNEQLHAAQEELALWRFQCLRQKCILIDREMRLEANSIPFESRCSVPVDESIPVSMDELTLDDEKGVPKEVSVVPEEDKPLPLVLEEGDDVDCEIVPPDANPFIDLSTESPPGDEPEQRNDSEPVSDEHCMEMSIDMETVAAQTEVEDIYLPESTPEVMGSKDISPCKSPELCKSTGQESEGAPINLDYLLDFSPGFKPLPLPRVQRPTPEVVSIVDMTITGTSGEEESDDKENKVRPKRKSGVTKLQYKAISNSHNNNIQNGGGKSILVKRSAVPDAGQRNVRFAADEEDGKKEEKKGVDLLGKRDNGVVVKKEPGATGGVRKAFKVNVRYIHSNPSATTNTEKK